MRKIRFFSLAMVLLLAFASFAACGPVVDPDNGQEVDETKTQLYVYVAQWGFGTEWFKQAKTEYEELNKDREFEKGKKGIQIIPQYRQSNLSVSEIRGDKINDVFFLEAVPYYSYTMPCRVIREATVLSIMPSCLTNTNGISMPQEK